MLHRLTAAGNIYIGIMAFSGGKQFGDGLLWSWAVDGHRITDLQISRRNVITGAQFAARAKVTLNLDFNRIDGGVEARDPHGDGYYKATCLRTAAEHAGGRAVSSPPPLAACRPAASRASLRFHNVDRRPCAFW